MGFKQGDIVSVDFPFSDGTDVKRRPALVLSTDTIHSTGDILLMQITSKDRGTVLNIPLENKYLTHPLPLKSFLRLHKIFTLDQSLVVKQLSHLEKRKFNHIIDSLFVLLKMN